MAGFHEAALPLQKAVVATLKANAAVIAIVADRVFDRPPPTAAKPYLSLGLQTLSPQLADEYAGAGHRFQIDAWSAGPGRLQVKQLAAAVITALVGPNGDATLDLEANQRCVSLELEQSTEVPEPDGTTQHEAMVFIAATEPTA